MHIREEKKNGKVRVELTAHDLAKLVGFLNTRAYAEAETETEENDYKSKCMIYEHFNTKIGGLAIALAECLTTGINPKVTYDMGDEEFAFLTAQSLSDIKIDPNLDVEKERIDLEQKVRAAFAQDYQCEK